MLTRLCWKFLTRPNFRCLTNFVRFGLNGIRAVDSFKKRLANHEYFPPFIFISLTDRCNLDCHGCWVKANPERDMDFIVLDALVRHAKKKGNRFFGILGGEPLLYERLFDLFAAHRDCYFQLFTNGLLLDDHAVRELGRLGNVTPLISVEGLETESDRRRGGRGVYGSALEAVRRSAAAGLVTGVATSVCKSSFAEVVSGAFLDLLDASGALYAWYYIYRPVGPRPQPGQALDAGQILTLRKFLVEERCRRPLAIIDAYWDEQGRALCPAATGISHHVNPAGEVEPCPPVQLSDTPPASAAHTPEDFDKLFCSGFLRRFREEIPQQTRGCILLDNPEFLVKLAAESGTRDSSGRGTVLAELQNMSPCPGHHLPGREIPERHWFYRFAKKHWFFGFGAYG